MTEEESQLRQENRKLREAYAQIQQESEQKDNASRSWKDDRPKTATTAVCRPREITARANHWGNEKRVPNPQEGSQGITDTTSARERSLMK